MPFKQLTDYRNHAEYTEYKGYSIAYWQQLNQNAQAETLFFIHGFPSAAWDWHGQWQYFAADFSLVALDMLGFGLSDKPMDHRYSVLEQADIVEHLCGQLGIRQLSIVAHDYGNSVAQELLSRQKDGDLSFKINTLCWLNGGLFAESHRPLLTQKLLHSWLGPILVKFLSKKTLLKSFTKIFGPETPPKQEEIDAIWALIEHKQGARVMPKLLDYLDERQTHRDRWVQAMQYYGESSDVRLSFINGRYDPISGEHMLIQFQQLLPNVKTRKLDVGHYPQLEAAKDVNKAIHKVMKEQ